MSLMDSLRTNIEGTDDLKAFMESMSEMDDVDDDDEFELNDEEILDNDSDDEEEEDPDLDEDKDDMDFSFESAVPAIDLENSDGVDMGVILEELNDLMEDAYVNTPDDGVYDEDEDDF